MKPAGPKVAARQGGGFRPGFGHFNEEHLEQQATGTAVQQKQLAQQTTQSTQPTTGHAAAQPGNAQQHPAQQLKTEPPRDVSGIGDELVKRPAKDIVKGLKAIFNINDILGIKPGDTPEEETHKKQLHQRWQKLDQEQQAVAKQLFEKKMAEEQQAEQEQEQQKQVEEEEKQQGLKAITPPTSPKKGPIGLAGSKKQKATQQLEQQRQSIGRVAGAN